MKEIDWDKGLILGRVIIFVIIVASLYQYQFVLCDVLKLAKTKAIVNWSMEAVLRGADATYGAEFTEFVRFLRNELPEVSEVILVPGIENRQVGDKYFMQYFLFPRHLRVCPTNELADCIHSSMNAQVFLVYTNGAPSIGLSEYVIDKIDFDPQMGILIVSN